jgi:hypothetical protein
MLHLSTALRQERLETVLPSAVTVRRTLFQQQLQSSNMLYVEQIQQLVMQYPHQRLLENVVTVDQPVVLVPVYRSVAHGTSATSALLQLRGLLAFVIFGHIRTVSRGRRSRKINVVRFG